MQKQVKKGKVNRGSRLGQVLEEDELRGSRTTGRQRGPLEKEGNVLARLTSPLVSFPEAWSHVPRPQGRARAKWRRMDASGEDDTTLGEIRES